jgi:hypothetical protein
MAVGNQISDVLVDAIVEALTSALQTNIDKADPAYVPHIQGGKLQSDPIVKGESWGHSVEVHMGDPDSIEDTWADELAGPEDPYIRMSVSAIPFAEIGGDGFAGEFWWRRGVVDINSYFIVTANYDRNEARQIHNLLRRRVEKVLGQSHGSAFIGLTDSEGDESVIQFFPVKSVGRESGGPDQFIWRGRVWWQALVERT